MEDGPETPGRKRWVCRANAHPVSKAALQSMLPTEGTGKRKPEEEDGGGRQKKEQEGDHFLHRRLGGKQKREMKEGMGVSNQQELQPATFTLRSTDLSAHPEEQHPRPASANGHIRYGLSTGLKPLCSLMSVTVTLHQNLTGSVPTHLPKKQRKKPHLTRT